MAAWICRFVADMVLNVIHTFVSVKRGTPLAQTELGSVLADDPDYDSISRSRRCGRMFWRISKYLLTRGAYLVLGFVAISVLNSMHGSYEVAYKNANYTYGEALIGTANQKCEGVLTVNQTKACNEYEYTLERWWITLLLRKFLDVAPSCGVMNCKDIILYLQDSWTAWFIWITAMISFIVVVIRIVNGAINWCSRCANAERVSEVGYRRERAYERLPAPLRHTVDVGNELHQRKESPIVVEMDENGQPHLKGD